MGQYYKPTSLQTNDYVYSWDFNNGLKLMEHSWIRNEFVNFVESLIAKGGLWENHPIVWAGDYANEEPDSNLNLYNMVKEKLTKPEGYKKKYYRYLINETTKTFVDKSKIPNVDGWKIHPLPLLTCEGNGGGGGDYFGRDKNNIIGTWARNIITVSTKKPKGYTELIFDLIES